MLSLLTILALVARTVAGFVVPLDNYLPCLTGPLGTMRAGDKVTYQ